MWAKYNQHAQSTGRNCWVLELFWEVVYIKFDCCLFYQMGFESTSVSHRNRWILTSLLKEWECKFNVVINGVKCVCASVCVHTRVCVSWGVNRLMNEWNKESHSWTDDNKVTLSKDFDESNSAMLLQLLELLHKYLLNFVVQALMFL